MDATADNEKVIWKNVARFCSDDPFAILPEEQATVGALRAHATDVNTSTISRRAPAARLSWSA